jgi:glycosyltransferase involved in cell wall biosynthesis
MNSHPKVSFCFTTFKRFDYLRDTLKSVQAQTFSDFEVIVSDNDPEQSGRLVVKSFDHRFKYFPNEENLGMKKSFNKSLERSSGEFIVMIADDDPVYPDMLETLLKLAEKYPEHGMYLGGCNWFCTDPDLADFYNCKVGVNSCLAHKPINEVQEFNAEEFLMNFFNFKIFPNYLWSCAIVKRDIMIEMGGVPEYGTAFLGDYAYMSIMGGHSGCVAVNKALGHQTLHKQNFGRAQNEQLVIVGPNFIDYVSSKLSHLNNWPAIKKNIEHFVAVWIVRHVAFLKAYSKYANDIDNVKEIEECEKKIFNISFMKPYKFKYYLLTHFPLLHDKAVKWKRKLRSN